MRRLLIMCVAMAASLLINNSAAAQVKLGYFDEEKLLPFMPGVKKVDTMLAYFERDTLGVMYDTTYRGYKYADSVYHKDSASMTPEARQKMETQINRYKGQILYWSKYSEQRMNLKEAQLLFPFKRSISDALMQVIEENGYTLVVNTSMLSEFATPPLLDNLTIRVAMKLNIPLAKGVMDDWKKALAKEAAKSNPKTPVKAKK